MEGFNLNICSNHRFIKMDKSFSFETSTILLKTKHNSCTLIVLILFISTMSTCFHVLWWLKNKYSKKEVFTYVILTLDKNTIVNTIINKNSFSPCYFPPLQTFSLSKVEFKIKRCVIYSLDLFQYIEEHILYAFYS